MKLDSWTVRFRFLAWALFSLTVLVALAGWVLVDRDPTKLDGLLLWTTAAAGIGEGGQYRETSDVQQGRARGPEREGGRMSDNEWRTLAHVLWILLLAGLLLFEGITVGRPTSGDTLSENVFILRSVLVGRIVVGAVLFWLAYHWVISKSPGFKVWDGVAAVVGIIVAIVSGGRRGMKKGE